MNKFRQCLTPVLLVAVGIVPLAHAQVMPGSVQQGSAVDERTGANGEQRDGISLDEAVRMAEAQFHARVVRTDVVDEDGRKVYVLKLLSEGGRVVTVRIDAATGRMR